MTIRLRLIIKSLLSVLMFFVYFFFTCILKSQDFKTDFIETPIPFSLQNSLESLLLSKKQNLSFFYRDSIYAHQQETLYNIYLTMGNDPPQHIHHYHETIRQVSVPDTAQTKALQNTINQLRKDMQNARLKCQTPEQFHQNTKKIEDKYIGLLSTMQFQQDIQNKKGFHVCFIGPTSCGKSSLLNNLFNLNQPVGLGSTTKQAKLIKKTKTLWIYWDAPGINKDFGLYKAKHLNFFNDLDLIFILFETEVESVRLIIKAFRAMKKNMKYVRTQCDKHKAGMNRTLKQELDNDVNEIREFDPSCNQVIPVGFGMYDEIKKHLK